MKKRTIRRSIAAAAVVLAGAASLAGFNAANAASATAELEREAGRMGQPATTSTTASTSSSDKFCKWIVNANGVALRTRPSSSSTRLGLLYKGNAVYGYVYKYNTPSWRYVRSPRHDRNGYVYKSYLTRSYCIDA
ncbi:MAG: hypothetical protein ACRDT4_05290 [Micromonosporaceae bacterium]